MDEDYHTDHSKPLFQTRYWGPVAVPHDQITAQVLELAKSANDYFDKNLPQLMAELLEFEPIQLLSGLSFWGLSTDFGIFRKMCPNFSQHHVEVIQTFVLRNAYSSYGSKIAGFHELAAVVGTINGLSETSIARLFQDAKTSSIQGEKTLWGIKQSLRSHLKTIRGLAYPQHINRLCTELFLPFDEVLDVELGVKVICLIKMIFIICEKLSSRHEHYAQAIHAFLQCNDRAAMIKQYTKVIGLPEEKANEFQKLILGVTENLEATRLRLLDNFSVCLPPIYKLSFEDFVLAYGECNNENALRQQLDHWSLEFGAATGNPEYYFLGNPIWKKPLIKLDYDAYLLPIIGVPINFCMRLMESVIDRLPHLQKRYEIRRRKYTEEKLATLFKDNFSAAQVFTGSYWSYPKQPQDRYENDVLVLNEGLAIVNEAKSAQVRAQGLRGDIGSLKTTVRKLIKDPSEQALRFTRFLKANPAIHEFDTKRGEKNIVDVRNIHEFIPLSITLEKIGYLLTQTAELHEAGLLDLKEFVPTITLSDLQIIFEILDSELMKLHYLSRRFKLEKRLPLEENFCYDGDEIDLLGFYLETGFDTAELNKSLTRYHLTGLSNLFEPYFNLQQEGIRTPKPTRRLTSWWREMAEQLERKRENGWIEIGLALLDHRYEIQKSFEEQFVQAAEKLKSETASDFNAFIIDAEYADHSCVLAGTVLKQSKSIDNALCLIEQELEKNHGVRKCLVIANTADNPLACPQFYWLNVSPP